MHLSSRKVVEREYKRALKNIDDQNAYIADAEDRLAKARSVLADYEEYAQELLSDLPSRPVREWV
jgi:hypothetical protein